MAPTDSRTFPERNVALRIVSDIISTTTGNPITGGLTFTASKVSIDGGHFNATTNNPVEILDTDNATKTGIFTLDLVASEMNGNSIVVLFSASNANAQTRVIEIKPLEWTSKNGRGHARFEELVRKTAEFAINQVSQSGAALTLYCDDGATVSVTGTFTPGDTTATRGAMG